MENFTELNLPEKIKYLPLEALITLADLKVRPKALHAVNALRRSRMHTVGDVLGKSVPELKALPHIGGTLANRIVELLNLLAVNYEDLIPRYKKEMILAEMRAKAYIL